MSDRTEITPEFVAEVNALGFRLYMQDGLLKTESDRG